MTSKPASRSARATTLAPRSCPSSPGLATMILIFASAMSPIPYPLSRHSDDRRLAVLTVHRAEDVADLADRDTGAHGVDDAVHGVLPRFGRAPQGVQRPPGGVRVPPDAHAADPLDLLGLHRGGGGGG